MERGSSKHGSDMDERLESTTEPIERSLKEPHVEEEREEEPEEDARTGSGHRVRGTGSSADTYPWTDRGEEGGASHPKPKDDSS